jgi:hypothetical protein
MKKVSLLFFILTLVLAGAAVWSYPLETSEETLPVTINVTDVGGRLVGFSVSATEPKELDFGSTFHGTTVIKTVNLSRGIEPPALVSLSPEGIIAPWTEVSDGEFLLVRPKQVQVSMKVPSDAREGTYSGRIRIVYKKTLFSILMR